MKALDVRHINPFLQATLSIMEQIAQLKLAVGKPGVGSLEFPNDTFIIQVGVTGVLKGQVLLVMTEEKAKKIASLMMMGMPVESLDDIATSALCELCNMIMGSTATLFSTQQMVMDITPPISLQGQNLKLQTDAQALKIPMSADGEEMITLYLCIGEDDQAKQELQMISVQLNDIVKLKKKHPCGSFEWQIVRVGADLKLKCLGCEHQLMMARNVVEKNLKGIRKPE